MKLKSSLTKTCWSEVREEVHGIDAHLAQIIDDINPSDDLPLYIAQYPYGEIIDDGIFFYPDEKGDLRPLSDSKLSRQVRDDFEYAGDSTPAGMVLDKCVEIFTMLGDTNSPWTIYYPGDIFALTIRLDTSLSFHPTKLTHITSGARNIFMVPNIGDIHFHKNLHPYLSRHIDPPKTLDKHWEVFKELVSSNPQESNWRNKLLLLSTKWMNEILHNPKWALLYVYLFKKGWRNSEFERNRRFYDIAFSDAQRNKNLKPNPYLADTAKHIFKILAASCPGFSIANSDISAPVSHLQSIYTNCYGLKEYYPHIVVPSFFDYGKPQSNIYYSLQVPTTFEFSPKSRKDSTMMHKLRELKYIIGAFTEDILTNQAHLENTPMSALIEKTNINFFHNKPDHLSEIFLTNDLPMYDCSLSIPETEDKKCFAYSGAFFRGCVHLGVQK